MTLSQKIGEIEILTKVLKRGWNQNLIFYVRDIEDFDPGDLEIENRELPLYDGWATVIQQLSDMLGVSIEFDKGMRKCILPSSTTSPEQVLWLIEEATAFINLMK